MNSLEKEAKDMHSDFRVESERNEHKRIANRSIGGFSISIWLYSNLQLNNELISWLLSVETSLELDI